MRTRLTALALILMATLQSAALSQTIPAQTVPAPAYNSSAAANAVPARATGTFGVSTIPTPYTSGTVLDFRAFSSIVLDCAVAPSAIVFNVSPDAANAVNVGTITSLINPIALTALQNNATSGYTTTSTGNTVSEWSVTGNKFAAFVITGGTCWISGTQ